MSVEITSLQPELVTSESPFWSRYCSPLGRGYGISFLITISVPLQDMFLKNICCVIYNFTFSAFRVWN